MWSHYCLIQVLWPLGSCLNHVCQLLKTPLYGSLCPTLVIVSVSTLFSGSSSVQSSQSLITAPALHLMTPATTQSHPQTGKVPNKLATKREYLPPGDHLWNFRKRIPMLPKQNIVFPFTFGCLARLIANAISSFKYRLSMYAEVASDFFYLGVDDRSHYLGSNVQPKCLER